MTVQNPTRLEVAALPQTDAILDASDLAYPMDPVERLRYLADNYHQLPLEILVVDTLMASAQRADQWVAERNASAPDNHQEYEGGHVEALTRALNDHDPAFVDHSAAQHSLRSIANGCDGFGDAIKGEEWKKWANISFSNDLSEAGLSENVAQVFRHLRYAEQTKSHIIRELEEHWVAYPSDSVPYSALSRRTGKVPPETRINRYWQRRVDGFSEAGPGLVVAAKEYLDATEAAHKGLAAEAKSHGIHLEADQLFRLVDHILVAVYLRTSQRDDDETVRSFRIPLFKAYEALDPNQTQAALEDLWLENPRLFTPASYKALGLNYQDAEFFQGLIDEENRIDEEAAQQRLAEQAERDRQFIADCNDPEVLAMVHEQLAGKVVVMTTKYTGYQPELRYIQRHGVTHRAEHSAYGNHAVMVVNPIAIDDNGRYLVQTDRNSAARTSYLAREFLSGRMGLSDVTEEDLTLPEVIIKGYQKAEQS